MHRLLIALDVPTAADAERHATTLAGHVGALKIGSQLFTAEGPALVDRLRSHGHRIFLDLKFHDIPHQVSGAVRSATRDRRLDADRSRIRRRRHDEGRGRRRGGRIPSSGRPAPAGRRRDGPHQSRRLGAGCRGRVATARRTGRVACRAGQDRRTRRRGVFAPGGGAPASPVRTGLPARHAGHPPDARTWSTAPDDQARTTTAAEAIAAGASYLVVGRPVLGAPDPRAAAAALVEEMKGDGSRSRLPARS